MKQRTMRALVKKAGRIEVEAQTEASLEEQKAENREGLDERIDRGDLQPAGAASPPKQEVGEDGDVVVGLDAGPAAGQEEGGHIRLWPLGRR